MKSNAILEVEVLKWLPALSRKRINSPLAPDVWHLTLQRHPSSLCLTPEAAKAVLDDSIRTKGIAREVGDDAVDLELQHAPEEGSQRPGVDEAGWAGDHEHTADLGVD